jgi:NitT/TauT family transport system substrate-binding protein
MMRRRTFTVALTAATFGSWTAARAQAPRALQNVSMAVGGQLNIGYLPLTLADRLGYFHDEGLNVDIDDFSGGTKSLEALVGGSVNFMTGSYENTIPVQIKGIDVMAVAVLTRSHGVVITLQKKLAAKYHSPRDLNGLKFGVTALNSSTSIALDLLLAKGGLTPDAVSQISIGQEAGAVAAIDSGQVDGAVIGDPVATRVLRDGNVVSILDARTEKGQTYLYGGDICAGSILTTPAFARSNPQAVQGVVNAIVRALKFMHTASADRIMDAVPPSYLGSDKDLYRASLVGYLGAFSNDGVLRPAVAANTLRVLNLSAPNGAYKVDLSRTYANTFAQKANQRYH